MPFDDFAFHSELKMNLDQSHQTVLENFNTFQRAQRCLEEIEEYIQSTLHELSDEFSAAFSPAYEFTLAKEEWSYLQTRAFPNWKGSPAHLITVGIEKFTVPDLILRDSGDGCRAYIYSELLADYKRASSYTTLAKHLRQMEAPPDFSPAPPQMHGYLFVKQLGVVEKDDFCSPSKLKAYFRHPLKELADWLTANAPHLSSLGGADAPATSQEQ